MEKRHRLHWKYFKELRATVKQAINDADPVGLLAVDAPSDEYDPVIGTMLPRLRSASSAGAIRTIIHEEFVKWFGEEAAGHGELCQPAAERIWNFIESKDR